MRTDATIDGRQVHCPKTSTLGYGKFRAQVGDWIAYTYPDGPTEIGRMIGRIHYAPALGESPEINDWIEVVTLSMEMTHGHIRWVNPEWVTQIHANAPCASAPAKVSERCPEGMTE